MRGRLPVFWGLVAAVCLAVDAGGQDVVISEFMASNERTLRDNFSNYVDWIEIHNREVAPVNLSGWGFATETNASPKWVFPATNLPAGGHMIVFCTERDLKTVGLPLHTSFKLKAGGMYLALLRPDLGVASEYAPEYPSQAADVSYGRYLSAVDRPVRLGALCKFKVPEASTPGSWMLPAFPDISWSNGNCGVGYQYPLGDLASLVESVVPTSAVSCYVRVPFVTAVTNGLSSLTLKMKYDDGYVAYLNGVMVASNNAPESPAYNSTALVNRGDGLAGTDEIIDISASAGLVVAGTNILALHVMDSAPGSGNLLVLPTLDAAYSTQIVLFSYFNTPTPGSSNVGQMSGIAEDVNFTPKRGFYYAPFALTMANDTPGAQIRYTLDGSKPTATSGSVYTVPIVVDKTSVIRAGAFRDDYVTQKITTHTFIFPNDVPYQSTMNQTVRTDPVYGPQLVDSLLSLPTVSVVMKHEDMFSAATGIYSNYYATGVAWERETSLEIINPDGDQGEQIDCGIRIYGGASRGSAKRGFRFLFKDVYGEGKLKYDLFPGYDVNEFDTLILKVGAFGNWNGLTYPMWDEFTRRFQHETEGVAAYGTFVHYFINGRYWGVFGLMERPAGAFSSSHYGGDKDNWDGINAGEVTEGSDTIEWNAMRAMVTAGLANITNYMRIQGRNADGTVNPGYTNYLDAAQHANYMLSHIWAGTSDWPGHNWYAAGRDVDPTGWKFYVWDAEANNSSLIIVGGSGPVGVWGALLANSEFKVLLGDLIHKYFFNNGCMMTDAASNQWVEITSMVEPALVMESARWKTSAYVSQIKNECANRLSWIMPRASGLMGLFKANGYYPQVFTPVFSQFGGLFTNGLQLTITASNTIYYTTDGTDPRQVGTGNAVGAVYSMPIPLSGYTQVKARARTAGGAWSALNEAWFIPSELPPVAISEVMYNPPSPASTNWNNDDFEFIEIHNRGTGSVALAHMVLSGQVHYTFTNGVLSSNQYGVLVANYSAFTNRYGTAGIAVLGVYTGRLANSGGKIELKATPHGPTIASFNYGDGRDWPIAADGGGHSLVPLVMSNQVYDLDYRRNWRASAYINGSPGRTDPEIERNIAINEITAHTDYVNPSKPEYDSDDMIELFNLAATNIAVADTNWYLSDSIDNLKKWRIPQGTVFTGRAWQVYSEVNHFHSPITSGFGLDKQGEEVVLSHLPGGGFDRIVDAVGFEGQENGVSEGRYPDGSDYRTTMALTPGSSNVLWQRPVAISEVMYNPPDTDPNMDRRHQYVELRNLTAGPVPLWTEAGTWRISGDADFRFPTNIVMPPNGILVVVPFNPLDTKSLYLFQHAYGLTNGQIVILGPLSGGLPDREGRISLERPQLPDKPGEGVSWVVVDEIIYFDRSPWSEYADGQGQTIERVAYQGCGANPASWDAGFGATPGQLPRRVRVTSPLSGATYYTPFSGTASAALHSTMIVPPASVEFRVNGTPVGVATTEPYSVAMPMIEYAGEYLVTAVLTDSVRTETSSPVSFICMGIDGSQGATEISDNSARVNGALYGAGGDSGITVWWGTVDGGTNTEAWQNNAFIGTFQAGPFATYLYGLESGKWYYYRFRAATGADTRWSAPTCSFFTRPIQYWKYRMRIGFGGYARQSTLTNFPVLVYFSNGIPGFAYTQFLQPEAKDLRFTDESGDKELCYDIEAWDPTNHISVVWVKVPEFRSNTCIYAYWGNTNAVWASHRNDGSVWTENYEGVWHMPENMADAAFRGHRAVDYGSEYIEDGLFDNARNFIVTNDSHCYPTITSNWFGEHINGFTLTMWVNAWSNDVGKRCLFGGQSGDSNNVLFLGSEKGAGKQSAWRMAVQSHSNYVIGPNIVHTVDSLKIWAMLGMVFRDHQAQLFVNGLPYGSALSYTDFAPGAHPLLGCMATGDEGVELVSGRMVDEMRLSGVARSPDWMWAEFMMGKSNCIIQGSAIEDGVALPPWWKKLHFGDAAATDAVETADADADGMPNIDEYIVGTDPKSSNDVFEVYAGLTNGRPCVWFPTRRPGTEYLDYKRYYSLDTRTNMLDTGWGGVSGKTDIEGDNTPVVHTNISENPLFFRGRVDLR